MFLNKEHQDKIDHASLMELRFCRDIVARRLISCVETSDEVLVEEIVTWSENRSSAYHNLKVRFGVSEYLAFLLYQFSERIHQLEVTAVAATGARVYA